MLRNLKYHFRILNGFPPRATGVRILATLLNELQRRKWKFGLETTCVGSGQGLAAIFERA